MNKELIEAINLLEKENNISKDVLLEAIENSLLTAYKNNYDTTSHLYDIYFKENSEAADATRIRDEKMEALNDFLSDIFILARIAFASKPDLLKQIT